MHADRAFRRLLRLAAELEHAAAHLRRIAVTPPPPPFHAGAWARAFAAGARRLEREASLARRRAHRLPQPQREKD